jgi:hypothetical protein
MLRARMQEMPLPMSVFVAHVRQAPAARLTELCPNFNLLGAFRSWPDLWHLDCQHTILEIGGDIVGLSICRQTKRALESAVFTFREEIGPAFLLALKSLLSLDSRVMS